MRSVTAVMAAILFSLSVQAADVSQNRIIACYRHNYPEYINNNCTHVIFRSGNVDQMSAYLSAKFSVEYYKKYYFRDPKKIILSINPVREDFTDGPQVISRKIGRSILIGSAIKILKKNYFDGLDVVIEEQYLDWISELLSEMRPKFDMNNLTLTALFPPVLSQDVDLSYIASNLDFVNIKSLAEEKTGMVTKLSAPLFADAEWSVDYSINTYINMGIPREKIVLGIPTFAVTHQLDDPEYSYIGARALKKGRPGKLIEEDGLLTVPEIGAENLLYGGSWIFSRDNISAAPYASTYLLWTSYDDETSVKTKASYIKENGLGGAMLWSSPAYDDPNLPLPFADTLNATLGEDIML